MDLLTFIKLLLFRQDIEGLLSMGAPYDEYDHESNEIFNKLSEDRPYSLEEVENIVFEVFDNAFCFAEGKHVIRERVAEPYHRDLTKDLSLVLYHKLKKDGEKNAN